ncbi:Benzoate--CoA ligase, peroxisomal [Nymphon striatum]|nr:Benzoate--CoA ligase, peroxisomal [Nymphon striatum]
MAGGVLNTINTRLEAATISYILEFAEAKVLMVDRELLAVATPGIRQVQASGKSLPIILIDDPLAATQPDIPEDLTVYRYDEFTSRDSDLQSLIIYQLKHFGKTKRRGLPSSRFLSNGIGYYRWLGYPNAPCLSVYRAIVSL